MRIGCSMAISFAFACTSAPPAAIGSNPPEPPDQTGGTGGLVVTDTDTGAAGSGGAGGSGGSGGTGGTALTGVVGFPYEEFDCSAGISEGPFENRILAGTGSNEDIALDQDGYLLAADWGNNIIRYTHEGVGSAWATAFGDPTGMELRPNGDLVVADRSNGRVVMREYLTDALIVLDGSISSPNKNRNCA